MMIRNRYISMKVPSLWSVNVLIEMTMVVMQVKVSRMAPQAFYVVKEHFDVSCARERLLTSAV